MSLMRPRRSILPVFSSAPSFPAPTNLPQSGRLRFNHHPRQVDTTSSLLPTLPTPSSSLAFQSSSPSPPSSGSATASTTDTITNDLTGPSTSASSPSTGVPLPTSSTLPDIDPNATPAGAASTIIGIGVSLGVVVLVAIAVGLIILRRIRRRGRHRYAGFGSWRALVSSVSLKSFGGRGDGEHNPIEVKRAKPGESHPLHMLPPSTASSPTTPSTSRPSPPPTSNVPQGPYPSRGTSAGTLPTTYTPLPSAPSGSGSNLNNTNPTVRYRIPGEPLPTAYRHPDGSFRLYPPAGHSHSGAKRSGSPTQTSSSKAGVKRKMSVDAVGAPAGTSASQWPNEKSQRNIVDGTHNDHGQIATVLHVVGDLPPAYESPKPPGLLASASSPLTGKLARAGQTGSESHVDDAGNGRER